jgi:two-component system CheB/CheR fusion protein
MSSNPSERPESEVLPVPETGPDDGAQPALPFCLVGIGASVGGMEAFEELLSGLPNKPGIAILFVQHLEPHHKSHLAEILGRSTSMTVVEAADGMTVEADHVYVIAPNTVMSFAEGRLRLAARPIRGTSMPIDHLFRSLASALKSRAIGVILSGGGTDGTLGFQSIKAEGGITFAQDEKTAKQDSMPRSAMADGCVDYVLSPKEIARQMVRLVNHSYAQEGGDGGPADGGDTIGRIIEVMRSATNVDFTHYKLTTIRRRIQRRMALRNVDNYDEYYQLLRCDTSELNNLYEDLLIRVTQFFRDPAAFEALKEKVFPGLVIGRLPDRPLRIWVAGCSTGEEVYSLAIALLEFLTTQEKTLPIKILATDLNEAALDKARIGLYVDNIEADVSPERLRRFFVRTNGYYQISKAVRDLCVFSRHNIAIDPPFSHLDLVSCRNVLIYMDVALQKRVLPMLHYSLSPHGYLFLGTSENIGTFGELFSVIDPKARIFSKRPVPTGVPVDFGAYVMPHGPGRHGQRDGPPLWSALDVQKEADRIVLARFAPVGVVADETMSVLQFRGRTAPYLEPAPGMASLDLFRMLREGLLADVRAAVNQAKTENVAVTRHGVRLLDGNGRRGVRIEVIPFVVPPSSARFFLILFADLPIAGETEAPPPTPQAQAPAAEQVAPLQQELTALREYLQSVIEEHESTNEELKSANEEILSANEELQSTNEELQTAKEESQSANEELLTVNVELNHRNAELAGVNGDLVNILNGVSIPIVLVSRDLRIRRFTPLGEKLFNLIPGDLGRPISDIKSNLDLPDITQLINKVIDTLTPYEGEVQDKDQRWYTMRIRPYVTLENRIDGASVVLLDVDSIKRGLMEEHRKQGPQAHS